MPEWIVSIIVAFCVVFIVFVTTLLIVFLMELPNILDAINRDLANRRKK